MNNNQQKTTEKCCHFCVNGIEDVDYKDINTIRRFTNVYKKILPRKRTGVCLKHQRKLSTAIKSARTMALLPYTNN